MTAKIVAACRRRPVMAPNIQTQAIGNSRMATDSTTLVNAVGFSKGWAELAPKKPPPLVPSCLTATKAATGPRAITCVAPSRVVTDWAPSSVIGTPPTTSSPAVTSAIGNRTSSEPLSRSRWKLPGRARPANPRASAASAASPVAAETNCSHINAKSWEKWLIAASPE